VALKDFIVAFFGWFALMGKNGIRIGDWVEINGVGGEVVEIGLLKTVLLEMGSWTSTGHPTGRQVSFVNSFALEGHYFNFSTAGQWLWDELQVTLPAEGDPYGKAEQIRQTVERETEADARSAEQDWERVTRQYGTRAFSAKPAVATGGERCQRNGAVHHAGPAEVRSKIANVRGHRETVAPDESAGRED
jgi:small-conductance mechanosensitive channel